MQDRLKTLEKLVFDACSRMRKSETESQALKLQVKGLARELERMQASAGELRELRDWRDSTKTKLKHICQKLDKKLH